MARVNGSSAYSVPLHQRLAICTIIAARRKPPDPREGFNPTSTLPESEIDSHVLRAACLRIQANRMENRSWPRTFPPVPISTISGVRRKSLLSALESGESEAVSTILEYLPAAKGMTPNAATTNANSAGRRSIGDRPKDRICQLASTGASRRSVACPRRDLVFRKPRD